MFSCLRVLPGNTRGRGGCVHCLLWLSDFSQLIPNPQTIQFTVDINSLFHYHEHLKLYIFIHYCLKVKCFFLKKLKLLFRKNTSNWSKSDNKYISKVTKDFQINALFFWPFYSLNNHEKMYLSRLRQGGCTEEPGNTGRGDKELL